MQRRLYIDEAHTALDIPLEISRFRSAVIFDFEALILKIYQIQIPFFSSSLAF